MKLRLILIAMLTIEEIKDLIINKKWYDSVWDGIHSLYVSASHELATKVTTYAKRYEATLPKLSDAVSEYEDKVKSHLERMGFVW